MYVTFLESNLSLAYIENAPLPPNASMILLPPTSRGIRRSNISANPDLFPM